MAVDVIQAGIRMLSLGSGQKDPSLPYALWYQRIFGAGDATGGLITLHLRPSEALAKAYLWSWEWHNKTVVGNLDPEMSWFTGMRAGQAGSDIWRFAFATTGLLPTTGGGTYYEDLRQNSVRQHVRGIVVRPETFGADEFEWKLFLTNGAGRDITWILGGYLWDRKTIGELFPRWPA